jgi:hypothetical protein
METIMADTGKKTGSGHPIHSKTSVPSPAHGNPSHSDLQSFDERGKSSVTSGNQHREDLVPWANEAHPKK